MKTARQWFNIAPPKAEAESATANVYIYAEIGDSFWGDTVSAREFTKEIAALDVDTLRVFINSPGGAAWDGITIMNALRRHRARIEVTVDGIAASAASIIAMAGDHISMNRGSEMMIHRASGFAYGNAQTMTETAEILVKLDDSLADVYQARAGHDRAHWVNLMDAETWFTAEEAVTAGLADEWVDAPAATASFDMSRFKFAARAQAPAPQLEAPELPSSSEPGEPNRKEPLDMSDTLKAGLRERLGVTDANASEETLLAALDETLEERANDNPAPAIPANTSLIDSEVLANLQADAAQGRQAREEQNNARRDSIVNQAVQEGRIAPAARDAWRAQLDVNEEGTATLLNSLATNTIPVDELGHQPAEASGDDAAYYAMFPDERPNSKEA